MNKLLHFPEELERTVNPFVRSYDHQQDENKGMEPVVVYIKETPKEYVFYADVPSLTKSDIPGNWPRIEIISNEFNFLSVWIIVPLIYRKWLQLNCNIVQCNGMKNGCKHKVEKQFHDKSFFSCIISSFSAEKKVNIFFRPIWSLQPSPSSQRHWCHETPWNSSSRWLWSPEMDLSPPKPHGAEVSWW